MKGPGDSNRPSFWVAPRPHHIYRVTNDKSLLLLFLVF